MDFVATSADTAGPTRFVKSELRRIFDEEGDPEHSLTPEQILWREVLRSFLEDAEGTRHYNHWIGRDRHPDVIREQLHSSWTEDMCTIADVHYESFKQAVETALAERIARTKAAYGA